MCGFRGSQAASWCLEVEVWTHEINLQRQRALLKSALKKGRPEIRGHVELGRGKNGRLLVRGYASSHEHLLVTVWKDIWSFYHAKECLNAYGSF